MRNRFEYSALGYMKKLRALLGAALLIILFVIYLAGIAGVSQTTVEKQAESLESAINRSIMQCYAIEGSYPPSLDYICEHYGLTYDDDLFFVDYTVYASNMMPDVTIITLKE